MKRAFTLIELLVVLAIIGVLVALLSPVAGKMLDKGRETKCASNLRQLHVAMVNFSNDNNGRIVRSMGNLEVGANCWSDALAQYVGLNQSTYATQNGTRPKGVFACPKGTGLINGGARSDYAMNPKAQKAHVGMRVLASLAVPSQVIFLIDAVGPNNSCTFELAGAAPPSGTWMIDTRHRRTNPKDGSANAIFFDGHLESKKITDFDWTGAYYDRLPWGWEAVE